MAYFSKTYITRYITFIDDFKIVHRENVITPWRSNHFRSLITNIPVKDRITLKRKVKIH